jgi:hypothetical protein
MTNKVQQSTLTAFASKLVAAILDAMHKILGATFTSPAFDLQVGWGPDGGGRQNNKAGAKAAKVAAFTNGTATRANHTEHKGSGQPSILWVGLGQSPIETIRQVSLALIRLACPDKDSEAFKAHHSNMVSAFSETFFAVILAKTGTFPDYSFGRLAKSSGTSKVRMHCTEHPALYGAKGILMQPAPRLNNVAWKCFVGTCMNLLTPVPAPALARTTETVVTPEVTVAQ